MAKRTQNPKRPLIVRLLPPLVIVGLAFSIYFFVDFTQVSDWFRSRDYRPTAEMQEVSDSLALTDRADLIFRASHPKLENLSTFSTTCGSDSEGTSILGCYTQNGIYIKNITDPSLEGILESTAAHELLHAVWARLPDDKRTELSSELDAVLTANQSTLAHRLDNYEKSRYYDELHSIAGTEYLQLSSTLTAHYAEYFLDRPQVVSYYVSYNSRFAELRAESEALNAQIEELKAKITANTENYEDGVTELNLNIEDFRRRAENGSFGNDTSAFYREQAELQRRADSLNALFETINSDIALVNSRIEKYNSNAAALNDLTNSITSPIAPPSV